VALGPPPTPEPRESAEHFLARAFDHARAAMKSIGHDVGDAVEVRIDPKLPFMGYSHPLRRGYRIVVSGGSLRSGMLEGLLLHEMSHIVRMRAGHVSHDPKAHEEAIAAFAAGAFALDYQQKALHDLINNVEDLYADDLSVRAMRAAKVVEDSVLIRFLQDWVTDAPVRTNDAAKDRWANAWLVANNARALAQMERHRIPDTGSAAAAANARLLGALGGQASKHFEFFRRILVGLQEEVSREKFKDEMVTYLGRFLESANGT